MSNLSEKDADRMADAALRSFCGYAGEVRKLTLTTLERQVIEASRHTDFGDAASDPVWSYSVCQKAGLDEKVYRGVLASLVKKDLINMQDMEGRGKYADMILWLNERGKEAARLIEEGVL